MSPLTDLFTSFWAAIDGRALSALDRDATGAAFLEALLECLAFMSRRLLHSSPEQSALLLSGTARNTIDPRASSQELAHENFGRVWEELSASRLRVDSTTTGKLLTKTLMSLHKLDIGTLPFLCTIFTDSYIHSYLSNCLGYSGASDTESDDV